MREILIIDDVESEGQVAVRAAKIVDGSAQITLVSSILEVYHLIRQKAPNLLIVDFMMPQMDGISLLRRIRKQGIDSPAILTSSKGVELKDVGRLVPQNNVIRTLCKPYDLDDMVLAISDALLVDSFVF